MKKLIVNILIVFGVSGLVIGQSTSDTSDISWTVSDPIFEKGESGSFDATAVKDPSIVYYNNTWHLFYTARGNSEYTTAYATAPTLNGLNTATRFELKQIRGKSRYGCAPQVFYFEPQKKWYLIFQNRDANYQPAFSTNSEISDPNSWSHYQNLLGKDTNQKWIDFWVIADKDKVYLFYTEAHSGVMVRSTKTKHFPYNWSKGKKVFNNIHEAVHIYKVQGQNEFHMIYELNDQGLRSFGMGKAEKLDGAWEKVTNAYASENQLSYSEEQDKWTEMVSHGEVIRSGHNQYLEYDPEDCRWLIQGLNKNELGKDYPSLPWKLGIIKMTR
jgi:hypothetical protein